jgi:hypothetical protein
MSGPQKKELALVSTATPNLTDKALFITNNKVRATVWESIYNLFKEGYNTLYATTSDLSDKTNKQDLTIVNIDAQGSSTLTSNNCVLSITNFPGGTGNRTIQINCDSVLSNGDFLEYSVKYKGFDVNFRSYHIEGGKLFLYLNLHSNPSEPVLIAIKKSN